VWKQDTVERAAAAGGSRMTFARRSVLELPLSPHQADGAAPDLDLPSPGAEFEPVSPLDVPAFLRRQNEV
jgi:hypothetical protein